jgi:hypothetical protein
MIIIIQKFLEKKLVELEYLIYYNTSDKDDSNIDNDVKGMFVNIGISPEEYDWDYVDKVCFQFPLPINFNNNTNIETFYKTLVNDLSLFNTISLPNGIIDYGTINKYSNQYCSMKIKVIG